MAKQDIYMALAAVGTLVALATVYIMAVDTWATLEDSQWTYGPYDTKIF